LSGMARYKILVQQFLNRHIGAAEFERQYLSYYKDGTDSLTDAEFFVLDRLFFDVDSFCPDENLRDEEDIDETELRSRCLIALNELNAIPLDGH